MYINFLALICARYNPVLFLNVLEKKLYSLKPRLNVASITVASVTLPEGGYFNICVFTWMIILFLSSLAGVFIII